MNFLLIGSFGTNLERTIMVGRLMRILYVKKEIDMIIKKIIIDLFNAISVVGFVFILDSE